MTSPQPEALTPGQVEAKLRQCVTSLTQAELALREARDAETEAEIDYRRASRKAILSAECPVPNRTDVTVAMRDAWVEDRCADEFDTWLIRKTATKGAEDHSRTAREVATVVMAIGANLRQTMSLAGYSGGR